MHSAAAADSNAYSFSRYKPLGTRVWQSVQLAAVESLFAEPNSVNEVSRSFSFSTRLDQCQPHRQVRPGLSFYPVIDVLIYG